MNRMAFGLALASVMLTAFAQIALKAGMSGTRVQAATGGGFSLRNILTVLLDPKVFIGLVVYAFAALVWLVVLSKAPVSSAYPLVSLGFVVTAVLGHYLFGEAMPFSKICAIALICVGVAILARG